MNRKNLSIELGCGNRKKVPHSVCIDILDYECVDVVGDVFDVLNKFPDAIVDDIYAYHFIEHVNDLEKILQEMARVLKNGGTAEIVVPHFSNPYFYSDYTHKNHFGLYSLSYFCRDRVLRRGVPKYNKSIEFDLQAVTLNFKSSPPFYVRHGFKSLLGLMFNMSTYLKEFYEENLCYMFPCYEIKYVLKRTDEQVSS